MRILHSSPCVLMTEVLRAIDIGMLVQCRTRNFAPILAPCRLLRLALARFGGRDICGAIFCPKIMGLL
jgi:hypothetical protein